MGDVIRPRVWEAKRELVAQARFWWRWRCQSVMAVKMLPAPRRD